MPGAAAAQRLEELRLQLEGLIERLSELADAKRMYGSTWRCARSAGAATPRPGPGPASAPEAGAAAGQPAAEAPPSAAPGGASAAAGVHNLANGGGAASGGGVGGGSGGGGGGGGGGAAAGGAAGVGTEAELAELLQRADEGSARMLALLADEAPAATHHQPLRGAALLAAGLAAWLRGGASEAAVGGLQAAVKLRPLVPTAWSCLAHSYWERGDLFMAGCCLSAGLRHCPSAGAHQMMSLLVRQRGGAAGAALIAAAAAPAAPAPAPGPGSSGGAAGGSSGGAGPQGQAAAQAQAAAAAASAAAVSAALTASLAHARRAVEMDLENGYSWYVLAMAQMAAYFRREAAPPGRGGAGGGGGGGGGAGGGRGELQRALAAFAQAERCGCSDLADLHHNRAALHAFGQDFGAALRDYSHAARLDPSLPCRPQIEALVALLGQLSGLVAGRGGVRGGAWAAVEALLRADAARGAEVLPRTHHERLTLTPLQGLRPGPNRGCVLLCRPLAFLRAPLNASGTLYLVCVDSSGSLLALALLHHPLDCCGMSQLLAVTHPELRRVGGGGQVDVTWPPPDDPGAPPGGEPAPGPAPTSPTSAPPSPPSAGPGPGPGPGPSLSGAFGPAVVSATLDGDGVVRGLAVTGAGAGGEPGPGPGGCRRYRFPLLTAGGPGSRSSVLVDGVPLAEAPQTPVLHHVMRAG
ncbi:hypothetical protein HYH03_014845 [Edaphochlamys debaryana]|uniref:Tetratricopeptide repeat protein 5 OB fold domain-containing protein n=1 Tax=Edaphochlamys debaryana TaxID=47281 RepID=A0A835XVE1_9CHLO|nr:hypothetical protein HYH03_014845 [Edaphochlamys debaryana]|eukprot:KAG2486544.1 hypothetical protein HYH03_014845 [Edaphochlamys debaryana]